MPEVSRQPFSYRDDPAVSAFDDSKMLFVFDGICVLCSGSASWIMRHDQKVRVNFTPAQEALGQALYTHYGIEMDESYLLIANGRAGQREHSLREVFNGLRYIVKTGAPWRWMPNDLPPWAAAYQQTQRWLAAGCFEALVDDLRAVLRLAAGRTAEPSAAIIKPDAAFDAGKWRACQL